MRTFPAFPAPARIGVLGVAFDEHSSWKRGAALAPPRVREAIFCDSSNLWTENETDLAAPGLLTDAGDIAPAAADMPRLVTQAASRLYQAGLKVLALGGDHSITFPLVQAASAFHDGLTLLHFDAHPDLYDDFGHNPHSHASPFARIMESGLARRLVQVGIRTMNAHQRDQARRFGVEVLAMPNWRGVFDLRFESPLYLSVDMDCLDPAFAPGVSHREPGGLSTRDVLTVVQALNANLVGADLVEFNPAQDASGITEMVAAKLFKEIAARMLSGR